jgi:hypothetical protein
MTIKEANYNDKLKQIREIFDAVPELYYPDEDEIRFLNDRSRLEKETEWNFQAYVENYEMIKVYGLDEKLIKQLEWLIVFYLENRKEEFLRSEFYARFKGHEVVRRAEMEYERRLLIN